MKIKTRIEDAIASSITESSINPAGNSRLDNRSLPPVSNCSKNAYDAFNWPEHDKSRLTYQNVYKAIKKWGCLINWIA